MCHICSTAVWLIRGGEQLEFMWGTPVVRPSPVGWGGSWAQAPCIRVSCIKDNN